MNQQVKTDDKLINHIRNVKLLQAIHENRKFFVECCPTDEGAKHFPNSNFSVKEIELPNFDLYEEKMGYRWVNDSLAAEELARCREALEEAKDELVQYKPAPDVPEITVEEFYTNTFNLSFLTPEEIQTIYTATELYARGKVRAALSRYAGEGGWIMVEDGLPELPPPYYEDGHKVTPISYSCITFDGEIELIKL